MRNCNDKIKVLSGKSTNKPLTLGEDLSLNQLINMTETVCSFYSGYPEVTDDYKESCPDCPLSLWFCDKLSTMTDDYLRELMIEYGKIITLKQKYHIETYAEGVKVEKELTGK